MGEHSPYYILIPLTTRILFEVPLVGLINNIILQLPNELKYLYMKKKLKRILVEVGSRQKRERRIEHLISKIDILMPNETETLRPMH